MKAFTKNVKEYYKDRALTKVINFLMSFWHFLQFPLFSYSFLFVYLLT